MVDSICSGSNLGVQVAIITSNGIKATVEIAYSEDEVEPGKNANSGCRLVSVSHMFMVFRIYSSRLEELAKWKQPIRVCMQMSDSIRL